VGKGGKEDGMNPSQGKKMFLSMEKKKTALGKKRKGEDYLAKGRSLE